MKNKGTVKCFRDANMMPANTSLAGGLAALGFKRTSYSPPAVTTTPIRGDSGALVAVRVRVETSNRTDETERLERNGWALADNRTVVEV